MALSFELNAEPRETRGKHAARRLRREKKVPAIIYGQDRDPAAITLDASELAQRLDHEAFFSHVVTIKVGGAEEKVVVRDMQRHPYKPVVEHMDFQRVSEKEKLRIRVPLHFVGEDVAPGVKVEGGMVSHLLTDVEVECLPRNIPEYVEVDLSKLQAGESVHLSQLKVPGHVDLVALAYGEEYDEVVASVLHPKTTEQVEAEAAAEEAAPEAAEGEGGEEEAAEGEGGEGGEQE